ncbi:hypothetical protein VCSRO92_3378 [Vibrio cholerae]|nr:hypothetical protein VCSRO92_3378 [Vibrio cholerae]
MRKSLPVLVFDAIWTLLEGGKVLAPTIYRVKQSLLNGNLI